MRSSNGRRESFGAVFIDFCLIVDGKTFENILRIQSLQFIENSNIRVKQHAICIIMGNLDNSG